VRESLYSSFSFGLNERANSHDWLRETHPRQNEGYRLGLFPLLSHSRFIYPNTREEKGRDKPSRRAVHSTHSTHPIITSRVECPAMNLAVNFTRAKQSSQFLALPLARRDASRRPGRGRERLKKKEEEIRRYRKADKEARAEQPR